MAYSWMWFLKVAEAGVWGSFYTEVGGWSFTHYLRVFISRASTPYFEGVWKHFLEPGPRLDFLQRPGDTSIGLPCLPRLLANFGELNLFILTMQPHLENVRPPSYPSLNVDLHLRASRGGVLMGRCVFALDKLFKLTFWLVLAWLGLLQLSYS